MDDGTVWNSIFARDGLVFTEIHDDMPRLAAMLEERSVRAVLDLGCGTGRHVLYLARRGLEVYGLDNSITALELTRRQCLEHGLAVRLVMQDIFQPLPFQPACFDAIVSVQVIHHARLQHIQTLAREMTRVLRPGGLLFVTVPARRNPANAYREIEPGTFLPLDGREQGLPHHYFTPETLQTLFSGYRAPEIHIDAVQHYCLTATKPT
jgi:SAM-dependent methyltransferase